MKLSKQKTKDLTIKVWSYLRDHPDVKCKLELPEELFYEIVSLLAKCPLCDYYRASTYDLECQECILYKEAGRPCDEYGGFYYDWSKARTDEERKRCAGLIVRAVEKWII